MNNLLKTIAKSKNPDYDILLVDGQFNLYTYSQNLTPLGNLELYKEGSINPSSSSASTRCIFVILIFYKKNFLIKYSYNRTLANITLLRCLRSFYMLTNPIETTCIWYSPTTTAEPPAILKIQRIEPSSSYQSNTGKLLMVNNNKYCNEILYNYFDRFSDNPVLYRIEY